MIASVRIVCAIYEPFLSSDGRLATPRKTLTAVDIFPGLNENASHARMHDVIRCYISEFSWLHNYQELVETHECGDDKDQYGGALKP